MWVPGVTDSAGLEWGPGPASSVSFPVSSPVVSTAEANAGRRIIGSQLNIQMSFWLFFTKKKKKRLDEDTGFADWRLERMMLIGLASPI